MKKNKIRETKSERLYRLGKIDYNVYSAMLLCEMVGQKGYRGSSSWVITKEKPNVG